eukprot:c20664_g1_i1 orf=598-1260(-)
MWITRFVVVVAFLAIGILFSPQPMTVKLKDASGLYSDASTDGGPTLFMRLVYLLSFATAWGMSLWVTFIGGVLMFKYLPRHQFGNLQSKLFPVYFRMLAVCAAVCLAGFAMIHPWKSATFMEKSQICCLVLSLVSTLLNMFVFSPLTMKLMRERHKVEREESIGDEVGISKNQEVAQRNPKLKELNKKFGMIHGFSSLANLFCVGGFAVHSWYLAGKLLL